MNKKKIINELKKSRENFLEAIQDLSDQEMGTPGVNDDWTVKDILVHLTRWEAELVKLLWQANLGKKPTTTHFNPLSVDEINARWYKESQTRPLKLVLDDFIGVRQQTIRRVDSLSDSALTDPNHFPWLDGEPLWKWIANDSFDHEAEHEIQIRNWQMNKEI